MSKRLTTQDFIYRAIKIHGDKYDYSQVCYENNSTPIIIICIYHGPFKQRPSDHLSGKQCKLCSYELRATKQTLSTIEFIDKSSIIHNNYYDYTDTVYLDSKTYIKIKCPIHGTFKQKPNHHMSGHGCKLCNKSLGESKIEDILLQNNIQHIREFTFSTCRSNKTGRRQLPFDFFLPEYNACIEYDGIQHYKPKEFFGGQKSYNSLCENDKIKTLFCETNKITLIRIPYWDFLNIHSILLEFTSNFTEAP